MILDVLDAAEKYHSVNAGFAKGFEFLRGKGLADLEAGRQEIDGDRIFAIVVKAQGKGPEESLMEVHRDYIDIQYTVAGTDQLGWRPLSTCTDPTADFNSEEDCQLFKSQPDTWLCTGPGAFAIFFPEDAHMPMISKGELHKVVVKVAVDQG